MQRPVPVALRSEPAVELGIAVDRRAFEQLTTAERAYLLEAFLRGPVDPGSDRAFHLQRVDQAIREVQRDGVLAAGYHATMLPFVQQAAQLAEAPAQLAPWIVRDEPQQVAKSGAGDRPVLEREQ